MIQYAYTNAHHIRLGYTLNFDNRPAEGGACTDYIIDCGFGREWYYMQE